MLRTNSMQFITLLMCLTHTAIVSSDVVNFETVRQMVFADPAVELPHYEVSKAKFGPSNNHLGNQLLDDAKRTLTSDADFVTFEHGQKLFQPNGICFSGRWNIDKPSQFTGLFRAGTDIPAIVRTSVMLSGTTQKDKRALGMAIKLFPPGQQQTINILVMESMGGKYLSHVTDAVLDNHPSLGSMPKIADLGLLLRIRKDLNRTLKETDSVGVKIRYLPLHHVAAANLEAGKVLRSPFWIRLRVAAGTPKIDSEDFREELAIHRYPGSTLSYMVSVAADNGGSKRHADWHEIGTLELTDSVVSTACDTKLHFRHHPIIAR